MRVMGNRAWLAGLAGIVLGAAISGGIAAATGDSVEINACVGHVTRVVRIPPDGERCATTETELSWAQQGTQGPPGVAGPQGPTGPQGPAGTSDRNCAFEIAVYNSRTYGGGSSVWPPTGETYISPDLQLSPECETLVPRVSHEYGWELLNDADGNGTTSKGDRIRVWARYTSTTANEVNFVHINASSYGPATFVPNSTQSSIGVPGTDPDRTIYIHRLEPYASVTTSHEYDLECGGWNGCAISVSWGLSGQEIRPLSKIVSAG